jgi:hypothetical protein
MAFITLQVTAEGTGKENPFLLQKLERYFECDFVYCSILKFAVKQNVVCQL